MNSKISKKQGRARGHSGLTDTVKSVGPRGILPSSLRGLAAALVCGVILLFVAAAIVYSTNDPNRYVVPTALTVLYISCFVGGFVATKCNQGAALICGGLTAMLLLILLFVASLPLSPSLSAEHSIPLSVGLRGIAVVFSLMGALAGSKEKKKSRKTHKKS